MQKLQFVRIKEKRHLYLIIYDISDDKRRSKVAKILESYGRRIQFSAFECFLESAAYERMKCSLTKIISNAEGDSIRIYNLANHGVNIDGDEEDSDLEYDLFVI